MNKVALLVHSCDRYSLLYEGFNIFFKENWDFSIKTNNYFATENIDVILDSFVNIKSGDGEWTDRLKYLLENKIEEQYILYLQEDMWLSKRVNSNLLNQIFDLAIKNNWKQVKLHSSEVYKTLKTEMFIEGYNVSKLDNKLSDFLMSHQITLWNKDFLINQLYKNEHPWRNERKGSKRLKKLNPEIFHVDCFAENGKKEINQNINPILRSEYFAVSNNAMLNTNTLHFLKKLENLKTNKIYYEKLKFNYENSITHDGKEKPMKRDIFKRTKEFLKSLF